MTDPGFFLALKVTGGDRAGGVLHDVAASALARIGYSAAAAADILRELDAELHERPVHPGPCDVWFRVEGDVLVIVLGLPGVAEWRLTRPLPAPD